MMADRISNLPNEVLEQVLVRLPIKEAVRSGVLSSQWRYRTSKLSHLVFQSYDFNLKSGSTLANIIDHVLLVHNGTIHKFQLTGPRIGTDRDIDRWILSLSQKSLKELVFEQYRGEGSLYKLPSCLFFFQDLMNLELYTCLLKPPSSFKGFKNLKSIDFEQVSSSQAVFENLITSCPLLERLRLSECEGFNRLNINAPNLKHLDFSGCFKDMNLLNTENLVDISMGMGDEEPFDIDYHRRVSVLNTSNLVEFLGYLPNHIQRLEFHTLFLMYLAIGALPGGLPKPYPYLRYLHLSISLTNSKESLTAVCLLRSCPVLQELDIQVNPWDGEAVKNGNSWLVDERRCLFRQLRRVAINDIRDLKGEVQFVRYLLMNSPVLERMIVTPYKRVDPVKMEKKFLGFKRASGSLKILFPNSALEPQHYFA